MQIRALVPGEPLPMQFLLLIVPSKELIFSYIQQSHSFVADKAGAVVGVLVLQPQGQMAEARNVAVDAQHQEQGIGRKLVEFAIVQAREQTIKQLIVCTGNSSLPALTLYLRCGFRVANIDKGYFLRTYPEPIFENGLSCTDRVKLRLELQPQP